MAKLPLTLLVVGFVVIFFGRLDNDSFPTMTLGSALAAVGLLFEWLRPKGRTED